MKKSPLFSSSNLMTLVFMLLYAVGFIVNFNNNNMLMAGIWGVLFFMNGLALGFRLLNKGKKNDK